MISLHPSRFRPQSLIILLVALGLLFAGVRVPDISRPHRPKPTNRIVLENHHKNVSDQLKHCGQFVAVVANPYIFSNPISFRSEFRAVSPLYASPLFFPNSGRSPPATLG